MRYLRSVVLTLAVLLPTASPALTDASAQTPDPQWTDAVRPGAGVTSPRVVKEVKPNYNPEALAAQIQGTVLVECVVEIDGTVRRARVARSLDQLFGLDQEAVDAVRRWQFEPGTKDGQPVPVLVTVELSWALQDAPYGIVPFMWPDAFGTLLRDGSADDSEWKDVTVPSSPLRLGFRHPKEWQAIVGLPEVAFLTRPDSAPLLAFMLTPTPTPVESPKPGTRAELQEGGAIVANGFNRELAAVGQSTISGRTWIWYDLGVSDAPNAILSLPSGRSQLWIFTTAVERQQVIVAFVIGESDVVGQQPDWNAEARRVGPTFRKILERLSFRRAK